MYTTPLLFDFLISEKLMGLLLIRNNGYRKLIAYNNVYIYLAIVSLIEIF